MNKTEIIQGNAGLVLRFLEPSGKARCKCLREVELKPGDPVMAWTEYFIRTGKVPMACLAVR